MLTLKKIQHWCANTDSGRLFSYLVLLPLCLVAVYLWLLLPDRYESMAKVTIDESSVLPSQDGLLASLALGGQGASQDEKVLQAYLVSADLLMELESELFLSKHYSEHSWDFVFGIDEDDPFEDLLAFYQKMVTVSNDDSGLLEVKVQAYTPEFSKQLADMILQKSEKFINQISADMAKKEMIFAQAEIERSQNLVKKAKSKLLEFQNENTLISPDSEGQSLISIVHGLEAELAQVQAELIQIDAYLNTTAPQVIALENKANALEKEIKTQKQRLTGVAGKGSDDKLIELGVIYQDLLLDVELSTTLYKSALSAYELARTQASKQLKFLVVASRPILPQKSLYPNRMYWFFSWVLILITIFGVVKLILLSIQEHSD